MSEWWLSDSVTSAPPFLLVELEKCIDRMKRVCQSSLLDKKISTCEGGCTI